MAKKKSQKKPVLVTIMDLPGKRTGLYVVIRSDRSVRDRTDDDWTPITGAMSYKQCDQFIELIRGLDLMGFAAYSCRQVPDDHKLHKDIVRKKDKKFPEVLHWNFLVEEYKWRVESNLRSAQSLLKLLKSYNKVLAG
jgi:hypothetical protein